MTSFHCLVITVITNVSVCVFARARACMCHNNSKELELELEGGRGERWRDGEQALPCIREACLRGGKKKKNEQIDYDL